jgi:site-specific DNA-methyltransferase (adenine-specific)
VLRWGTGGVNVDGCRVGNETTQTLVSYQRGRQGGNEGWQRPWNQEGKKFQVMSKNAGRFPANLIHDGSAEVVGMFPVTTSGGGDRKSVNNSTFCKTNGNFERVLPANTGSAARFFKACPPDDAASLVYCAKASRSERDAGLDGIRYKLRDDLTDEQRAFVMAELEAYGVLKRQIDDA